MTQIILDSGGYFKNAIRSTMNNITKPCALISPDGVVSLLDSSRNASLAEGCHTSWPWPATARQRSYQAVPWQRLGGWHPGLDREKYCWSTVPSCWIRFWVINISNDIRMHFSHWGFLHVYDDKRGGIGFIGKPVWLLGPVFSAEFRSSGNLLPRGNFSISLGMRNDIIFITF